VLKIIQNTLIIEEYFADQEELKIGNKEKNNLSRIFL